MTSREREHKEMKADGWRKISWIEFCRWCQGKTPSSDGIDDDERPWIEFADGSLALFESTYQDGQGTPGAGIQPPSAWVKP